MTDLNVLTDLKIAELVTEFRHATSRLILLDYDGTLVTIQKHPDNVVPGDKILRLVQQLASEPKNTVAIITGRDKKYISKWFGDMNVHIFAEHGSFVKEPGQEWSILYNGDQNWKSKIFPILKMYTDNTKGAMIEEKVTSIAWHYRNVDPMKMFDIVEELYEQLQNNITDDMNISILEGKKVMEIKQKGFDKGTSCKKLMALKNFSFILSIGDDVTDEDMFKALPLYAHTFKVGYGPTNAKMNLENTEEVEKILERLL